MTGPGRASGAREATGEVFDPVAAGVEIQRRIGVKTSRDEPLGRFTTLRAGGPADLFAIARNAFELRALVKHARARGIPFTLLGRGSNVVISDRGIRGLVVQDRAEGWRIDGQRLIAEAGLPMARAATETTNAGLAGLEFGLAIPGTVGGAVWANAGAHDGEIARILESATVLQGDGTDVRLAASDLGFAYRESRFKVDAAEDGTTPPSPAEVVTGATFLLEPEDPEVLRTRLDDIRRWRRDHQPLGLPSAGSVFRNPPGDSAGRLIDVAGCKGMRVGGAAVSTKHANFIVNDQRGSAADIRRLADRLRAIVAERHGVTLEFEIEFLGDWDGWPWDEGTTP
jgi:UDP-N-acetylmuramate dehydrogenase